MEGSIKMFLARSTTLKYVGFHDNRHCFKGTISDEYITVSEAKFLDMSSFIVLVLFRDGNVMPTYGTIKKFGNETAFNYRDNFINYQN